MAFDPHREDYERLGLRLLSSLGDADGLEAQRAFLSFRRRFAYERDSLPQTDADRAFHLVAEATQLIDFELPFALDEEAETIISRAHQLLGEAIALDGQCHDAIRMEQAARHPTFEGYYEFLQEGKAEVRARCEEARDAALAQQQHERAALAANIAMRPYLRWVAMLASKALICGRNRETLALVNELLELDPTDAADARFTGALAYAKLEDEAGLDAFQARCLALPHPRGTDDAWMLLARLALAHKRLDLAQARELVARLVELYPNGAAVLTRQRELPDGVFARLAVAPFSEDELILAISEGTVLLQEGRDSQLRGSLGSWVMREALALATPQQREELADVIEALESGKPMPRWGGDGA